MCASVSFCKVEMNVLWVMYVEKINLFLIFNLVVCHDWNYFLIDLLHLTSHILRNPCYKCRPWYRKWIEFLEISSTLLQDHLALPHYMALMKGYKRLKNLFLWMWEMFFVIKYPTTHFGMTAQRPQSVDSAKQYWFLLALQVKKPVESTQYTHNTAGNCLLPCISTR